MAHKTKPRDVKTGPTPLPTGQPQQPTQPPALQLKTPTSPARVVKTNSKTNLIPTTPSSNTTNTNSTTSSGQTTPQSTPRDNLNASLTGQKAKQQQQLQQQLTDEGRPAPNKPPPPVPAISRIGSLFAQSATAAANSPRNNPPNSPKNPGSTSNPSINTSPSLTSLPSISPTNTNSSANTGPTNPLVLSIRTNAITPIYNAPLSARGSTRAPAVSLGSFNKIHQNLLLESGVRWLVHPSVISAPRKAKELFLKSKGIGDDVLSQVLKREKEVLASKLEVTLKTFRKNDSEECTLLFYVVGGILLIDTGNLLKNDSEKFNIENKLQCGGSWTPYTMSSAVYRVQGWLEQKTKKFFYCIYPYPKLHLGDSTISPRARAFATRIASSKGTPENSNTGNNSPSNTQTQSPAITRTQTLSSLSFSTIGGDSDDEIIQILRLMPATLKFMETLNNIISKGDPPSYLYRYLDVHRYLGFLSMKNVNRTKLLVPPIDVRVLWYLHMWNSDNYLEFCNQHYGSLIDHRYEDTLSTAIQATQKLWETEFPYSYEWKLKKDNIAISSIERATVDSVLNLIGLSMEQVIETGKFYVQLKQAASKQPISQKFLQQCIKQYRDANGKISKEEPLLQWVRLTHKLLPSLYHGIQMSPDAVPPPVPSTTTITTEDSNSSNNNSNANTNNSNTNTNNSQLLNPVAASPSTKRPSIRELTLKYTQHSIEMLDNNCRRMIFRHLDDSDLLIICCISTHFYRVLSQDFWRTKFTKFIGISEDSRATDVNGIPREISWKSLFFQWKKRMTIIHSKNNNKEEAREEEPDEKMCHVQ